MSEASIKLNLKVQKRITKSLTKAGKKRIKFVSEALEDIKAALTKKDIRGLIKRKSIKIKQKKNSSRSRIRKKLIQKRKGRGKGLGSRKGKKTARLKPKEKWMNNIRAQRKIIKELREKKLITPQTYRKTYLKSKGGFFRSRRHILTYLTEHNLMEKKK